MIYLITKVDTALRIKGDRLLTVYVHDFEREDGYHKDGCFSDGAEKWLVRIGDL